MAYSYLQLPPELTRDRRQEGSVLADDYVAINDVVLRIPPEQISVYKESLNSELATLRSFYTQKIKSGQGNVIVNMQVTFRGNEDFNQRLKYLIAGLRATPFCTCYSSYLQRALRGLEALASADQPDYFFFRPISLGIKNITISTVPQSPDCLSVELEFVWFNYYPYMNEWVYRIGAAPFAFGTVFHSELWREFYKPFLSSTSLKWPHNGDTSIPQAQLFFREYLTEPAFDPQANQAAIDLLEIIKRKPQKTQELLQNVLKDENIEWTDQNIWDVFYKQVGKDALLKDKDVNEEIRQRFQQSEVADGAITSAIDYSGIGHKIQMVGRQAYNLGTKLPQGRTVGARREDEAIENAIRVLTQRNQQIVDFEKKRPTRSASSTESGYVPLPELTFTHDYSNDKGGGVTYTSHVFGRKRKLVMSPDEGIIVESISVNIAYNLAVVPMMAYRYPTMQYTGGVDITASFALNCTYDAMGKVNAAYDVIESMAHRYRMVPQGYQNMWIQNDLLNFLGLKEFINQKILTQTIPGQPGRSSVILELSHAPVTSTVGLKPPESLNQEAIWTSDAIRIAIIHKLHELTSRAIDRQSIDPTDMEAYLRQPNFNDQDPKKKAISELVHRYQEFYNTLLTKTMQVVFSNAWTEALGPSANAYLAAEYKRKHGQAPTQEEFKQFVKKFQDREAAALKRREDSGVSKDFSIRAFSFLMSLDEKSQEYGVVPNIVEIQNSIIHRENARLGRTQNSLLPGSDGQVASTSSAIKSAAHDKRLRRTFGITKEENADRAASVREEVFLQKRAFSFIEEYQAGVNALSDDIQLNYLDLAEFKEIRNALEKAGVVLQTSSTYHDFEPQLKSVVSYLQRTDFNVSPLITHYNPDVYMWNRLTDGPLVNLDDSGILDPRVLERAKSLSKKAFKSSIAASKTWFQNNYYSKLGTNQNTFPAKWLEENVQKDKAERGVGAGGSPYNPFIYSETRYGNALFEQIPEEDDQKQPKSSMKPICKRITVDQRQKSHVNQAYKAAMECNNTCPHTLKFDELAGKMSGVGAPANVPRNTDVDASSSPVSGPVSSAEETIVGVALEYGLDPNDLLRVAQYESGMNPQARNPSGAAGIFQLMPSVASAHHIDPYSVEQSARYVANQMKSRNLSGYDFYLEHNQGQAGARAIKEASQGKEVSGKLGRKIEYNMANQPLLFNVLATPEIRAMPTRTKEQRLARQQALADEARRRFSRQQLANLFLTSQRDRFEKKRVRAAAVAANRSQPVRRDVVSTTTSALELAHKEFENDMYTGQALGLHRAYPCFKLFFIEDDQGERRLGFDDFFNYSAVQSIRIVRDRNIAADLCEIYLSNLSGVLSNRRFSQERNPEKGRSAQGKVAQENTQRTNTKDENPLASMMLREGVHFSLYLGYSNRLENLELVFTGVITELEFMGSDEVVRILGQSYGIELVQDIKGVTKPDVKDNMSIADLDFWGIGGNAYTNDLLEEMITQPEVLHFGRWDPLRKKVTPDRDLLTNKYLFRPKPQDDNIFAPPPKRELRNFADGIVFKSLRYVIYQTTIWDIFQEMTLRHPNFIAQAVPYKEIGNDRMTMFFGLPNQLYFARDPDFKESNATAAMRRAQVNLQKALVNAVGPIHDERDLALIAADKPELADQMRKMQKERLNSASAKAIQDSIEKVRNDRLKYAREQHYIRPFRRYHLLTSAYHIVANNIQANTRDVANTITIRYNDDLPGTDDIVQGVNNANVALANADQEVTVKLDAALPDEEMRTQVAAFLNVHNGNLARRYALGLLLRNTRNTYKGEIIILGNPRIKPNDVCYLFDQYNDMIGPIEVDRVVHVFTPDQGFLTEIKPGMLAQVGEWTLMHSATAMGVVMEGAVKHLFGERARGGLAQYAEAGMSTLAPVAGALFDFFGGFMSDAILNYTQFGFPLMMTPLMHRGRIFAGGVPTHKLPKSMWKCIFGDWTNQAERGFDQWLEDKLDEILGTLKTATLQNRVGASFWNNANTLEVE